MKPVGTLFFGLLLLCKTLSGQVFQDLTFYLNSKQVSKTAKDFYNGKFKANDSNKTLSILDSLKTSNNITRPFYIYLVSKIIYKPDGALAEALGLACKEFIEKNPNHLIEFLSSTNKAVDQKSIDNWACVIASEFMIDCEGREVKCVKASLQQALTKAKPINKPKLQQLYTKIERYCH